MRLYLNKKACGLLLILFLVHLCSPFFHRVQHARPDVDGASGCPGHAFPGPQLVAGHPIHPACTLCQWLAHHPGQTVLDRATRLPPQSAVRALDLPPAMHEPASLDFNVAAARGPPTPARPLI